MNRVKGKICSFKTVNQLSLIEFSVGDTVWKSIVIETPKTADYLEIGKELWLMFKETEVVLSLPQMSDISLQNRITGSIIELEFDEILARVVVNTSLGNLTAVVTYNAITSLGLKMGSEVQLMIKTNEIMLKPC